MRKTPHNPDPHHGLRDLSNGYALDVGNADLSIGDRALAADRLRPLVSSILLSSDTHETRSPDATIWTIVDRVATAVRSLLELGNGYELAMVKMKLDAAYKLMGALDEVASSASIPIEHKMPVIVAAETLIVPALRMAVRLVDPDRVEFISDAEIGLGQSAMSVAWRASAIVHDKSRDLRLR